MVFLYFYDLRFRRYLDPLSYTFSSGKLANGWGESGKIATSVSQRIYVLIGPQKHPKKFSRSKS